MSKYEKWFLILFVVLYFILPDPIPGYIDDIILALASALSMIKQPRLTWGGRSQWELEKHDQIAE